MASNEKDALTGIETTGHEWDGLKELNNPLPRWWIWIFLATVVWSIGYYIAMPSWPLISSYTKGMLGYSQRQVLADQMAAADAAKGDVLAKIKAASVEEIMASPDLLDFARQGGASAFAVNCQQCHGAGAAGNVGFPNLVDDDWIWGGTVDQIYQTIQYGIRSDHPDTRVGDMLAFGKDGLLEAAQVSDVVEHVLAISGQDHDAAAAGRGATVFAENCAACHGENAKGMAELGAPNLTDGIWLYGGDRDTLTATLNNGRAGMMPAWAPRLPEETVKQLAVYVHTLGGGQ